MRTLKFILGFIAFYFGMSLFLWFTDWLINTFADVIAIGFFTTLFGLLIYALVWLSKGND